MFVKISDKCLNILHIIGVEKNMSADGNNVIIVYVSEDRYFTIAYEEKEQRDTEYESICKELKQSFMKVRNLQGIL